MHLVHDQHLIVNLDAEVVCLNDELVLCRIIVGRQVGVRVLSVVFNFLDIAR